MLRISRRSLVFGLAACPLCAALARGDTPKKWNFESLDGLESDEPFVRKELNRDPTCIPDREQSPVALQKAVKADIQSPTLQWRRQACKIKNDGHTIQAVVGDGNVSRMDGRVFRLKQFHFHAPSEHTIEGKRSDMEVHFVHEGDDKDLMVVGALIRPGRKNEALATIMAAAPTTKQQSRLSKPFDPTEMLPGGKLKGIFRYEGSLTTDPHTEIVNWIVARVSTEAAKENIDQFKALYPDSARELQPLHGRLILRN